MVRSTTFTCLVQTPDGQVLQQEEIVAASVPAFDGQMGVLGNHAPMVTTLGSGTLLLRAEGERRFIVSIEGGFAEVRDNVLIVLPDRAGKVIEHTERVSDQAEAPD